MTHFKTLLMTAALMAVPTAALAQVSTDAVKDKAVETILDNATTEDAVVAGTTMLKGGSKEDAAIAVVKNRVDGKIESMTGGVGLDDLSKDGVIDAGKEMAQDKMMEKAAGSATTYTDGVSVDGAMDAGKDMALDQAKAKAKAMSMEKAKMNGETWGMSADEKAKRMITSGHSSGEAHIIQKSGAPMSAPAVAAPTAVVSTLNCPAGTKDAGDGTCMITGDWKP